MFQKTTKKPCEECKTFRRMEGYRFCHRCADAIRAKISEKYDGMGLSHSENRSPDRKEKTSETKHGVDE